MNCDRCGSKESVSGIGARPKDTNYRHQPIGHLCLECIREVFGGDE